MPGDPNDVLARFYGVAQIYDEAQTIIRICADCPLVDASIIDGLLAHYAMVDVDHVGIAAAWGDGLDCEAFHREALERAMVNAVTPSDREHVTPWMHRSCACALYPCPFDLSWLHVSVDTPDDLTLLETVLQDSVALGYGLSPSWRDLAAICSDPRIKNRMQERPINQAYVEQVAAERGGEQVEWRRLRYEGA